PAYGRFGQQAAQVVQLAHVAPDGDTAVLRQHRHPSRIITTILQPFQAVVNHRCRVARPNIPNNTTHKRLSSAWLQAAWHTPASPLADASRSNCQKWRSSLQKIELAAIAMHLSRRLPVWFHASLSVEGIIPPAGESLADWMQCV